MASMHRSATVARRWLSGFEMPNFRRTTAAIVAAVVLGLALSTPSAARTNLPLPRFVSLGAGEVNLRTGPGTRYPVKFVYVRRHLPVEIIAEYQQWRKIRDHEGDDGWVHQSLLSGRRTVILRDGEHRLFDRPDERSLVLLRAEPGVQGDLITCQGPWCRVEIADTKAWVRRAYLWGVYPDETFD